MVSDRALQCGVQVQLEHANVARYEYAGIFRVENDRDRSRFISYNNAAIQGIHQKLFVLNLSLVGSSEPVWKGDVGWYAPHLVQNATCLYRKTLLAKLMVALENSISSYLLT